ncbi:MAG: hypothetical protein IJ206_10685 [Oscillospiraceae bacterium]|nr:hypothetical protein [Oscillospiraceae bacterium]
MRHKATPGDSPEDQVEQALLQRALGLTVTETRTEVTEKGEKTVRTEKELPPDLSAQVFWLKNRCPEKWREKPPEPQPEAREDNLLEMLRQAAEEPGKCAMDP